MSAVNPVQGGPEFDASSMEPPASIGRRVFAYVIDGAIAALIGSVAVIGSLMVWIPLLAALAGANTSGGGSGLGGVSMLGFALMFGGALLSLAWTIIWVLMQGGRGSVGMRLLKIRLIRRGLGTKIGFWRALGRQVVFSLLAGVIVGYFTPLFDRSGRRQGWHDLMVGAIMVDEPAFAAGLARAAALAAAPPPAPEPAPIEQIDRDRAFGLPVAPPAVPPLPGARGAGAGIAPAGSSLPPASVISDLPPHLGSRGQAGGVPPGVPPMPAPLPPAGAAPVTGFAPPPPPPPAPGSAPAPGFASAPPPAPRLAAPAPAAPAAAPAPQLELRWDDGIVVAVAHGAILGRDPVASTEAARVSPKLIGALSVPVADSSMSLSKTHFGVGVDRTGAWIVDLHSTNGTILHRQGIPARPLVPGELTAVQSGDTAVFGTRQVTLVVSGA